MFVSVLLVLDVQLVFSGCIYQCITQVYSYVMSSEIYFRPPDTAKIS